MKIPKRKPSGPLQRDNLDKGNKIKPLKGHHKVKGISGDNIILANVRSSAPKDVLKNT